MPGFTFNLGLPFQAVFNYILLTKCRHIEISVNAVLQNNIENFNNDRDNDQELDVLVQNLSKIASVDPNYKTILNYLKNGFSTTKSKTPQGAKPYWDIRNDLSIDSTNNLIIYNGRIVVPKEARRDILKKTTRE